MDKNNVIVIGIAGGTCSGKSTLIGRLKEHFADQITMISHDYYYRAHDEMPFEERCKLNYDHPESFETDLMLQHIEMLKNNQTVEVPIYDYTIHNRSKKTMTIKPSKVIVVEGILIFENKKLREMFDIKVFVDADADIRIIRRNQRDAQERGRSLESVIDQYMTTVKPMHEQFVEPSKKYADIIVPQGGLNNVAFQMLTHRIHALLGA